jgi:hypothetical protein
MRAALLVLEEIFDGGQWRRGFCVVFRSDIACSAGVLSVARREFGWQDDVH